MTIENLIKFINSNGYICPNPDKWIALSQIIGVAVGGNPLTPLVLAGWNFSSDFEKKQRLLAQIEYAYSLDDSLRDKFIKFIHDFNDNDWHKG